MLGIALGLAIGNGVGFGVGFDDGFVGCSSGGYGDGAAIGLDVGFMVVCGSCVGALDDILEIGGLGWYVGRIGAAVGGAVGPLMHSLVT